MNIKKIIGIVLISLGLLSGTASGSIEDRVYITGKIRSIKKDIVTMTTRSGKINVPRKYFNAKHKKFRPGKRVRVLVSLTEIVDLHERGAKSNYARSKKKK